MPDAAQEHFHTASEIHGRIHGQYGNVSEIRCAIARGNVQTLAKGDRQVRQMPTHALPFAEGLEGRLVGRANW